MTSTEPKQKAELRVALHDNGKYLLLLDARVTGWDVYIGSGQGLGKKKAKFRLSWHESGEIRRHIFGAPSERGVTRERPQEFTGITYLGASAILKTPDWNYNPKPDSKQRRTLIVDVVDTKRRGCSVDIWAVERGRDDPVKEILSDQRFQGRELVGHVIADWTQPQLVVLAYIPSDSTLRSFHQSLILEYSKKIQVNPRDAHAYADKGIAHFRLGEYQSAIDDFETSVRLDPESATRLLDYRWAANELLAASHLNNGEWAKSIHFLDEIIKLKPGDSWGWAHRGMAYLMERQLDESLEDLNEAMRLDPDLAKALYNRACLHSLRNDATFCASDLEKSIAREPDRREQAKNDPDLEWARSHPTVKAILGIG